MKTYIERTLEKIRKIADEKNWFMSCDIYYNEFGEEKGEQYVVKLHNSEINEHFRSSHIRKSLREALKYVKALEKA